MKKSYFLLLFFLGIKSIFAQVGINTTTPNAQLEIKSSDQAAPSNTDGILIPKVDVFPATNPTATQQGMMVYLTTTSGTDLPGFYYWDNSGTPSWKPIAGTNIGTLDQAYDFGGAGNGKTITADAGAVTIDGTDGLVSTGVYTSGAIAPSGPGTRMVWNPRKAAFRAGDVDGTQWDDENIGIRSVAFGLRTTSSGNSSSAFGQFSIASGAVATAFGRSTASGSFSTSFGYSSTASNQLATAFGFNTTASGNFSTAFGYETEASGDYSTSVGTHSTASGNFTTALGWNTTASGNFTTAFGYDTEASGEFSTAFGQVTIANGKLSTSFGRSNTAKSYGETALGIGATDYTPSTNGDTQFRTPNATDRLFVIGNAIDTNDNDFIDASERSDALVILKNGNAGFGSSTPQERLHLVGNLRMVDGNQAIGKILTCDANGTATWQNPAVNAWGLIGNSGTNPIANFIGTTDNQSLAFRTNNIERVRILTTGEFGIGTTAPSRKLQITENTPSTINGQLYIEQSGTGDAFMHFGNTGARHFNMGLDTSAESFKISTATTAPGAVSASTLITLQSTGEFGLGTVTPDRKLEVSGTAIGYARITSTSSSDVGIELKRSGSDWQMRNDTGDLVFAQSNDDLATVTDVVRVGGGSFTPVTDNAIPLGQSIRRWTSVHAVNGVIQTSDATDKKEMLPLSYGLEKIKSLRPISFQWKDAKIDNSSTHLGFVAQEVQQVLPEVVVDYDWKEIPESQEKTWEKTEKLGMKYAEIIPVLVKAIQEQQVIIEELKTKIEALEKK
ncbi:MAG: tail fiber domain-containing protein [Flavobacterium sp.]|uniref:tail fiber domain-containing protein n=1 Tax=Flavobacterium sp. TaxID=239 RepID=UPI0022CBE1A3|nr:tail fiber domain-containing protein [Flavobacterium sp.]MCZ8197918.1 tail fiber domain-containing protein [Flavobacterium sp.]